MKQKKLIGYASEKQLVDLERNDIRRFSASIGSTNPIHFDPVAAKKAGFKNLVAPSSMAASFGHHSSLTETLEVHAKNVLHSEQTVELRRPLLAGDSFKVSSVITDIQERPIGNSATGFVTIEDRATDLKGKMLFLSKRVLAVRGGFPRR